MALKGRDTRQVRRGVVVIVLGIVLGGLLTLLAEFAIPPSATREFLVTSVSMSVGPFFLDLVAVSLTVGPISFAVNALTVVGVALSALAVRSWM